MEGGSERVGEEVTRDGWLGSGWIDREVKGVGGGSGWFGVMWQEGSREGGWGVRVDGLEGARD